MNFYKLDIRSAHLIGGFAQVKWFKKNELVNKQNQGYASSEVDIMNHMNDHHNESIKLYLQKFIKNIKATEKSGGGKLSELTLTALTCEKKIYLPDSISTEKSQIQKS